MAHQHSPACESEKAQQVVEVTVELEAAASFPVGGAGWRSAVVCLCAPLSVRAAGTMAMADTDTDVHGTLATDAPDQCHQMNRTAQNFLGGGPVGFSG